MSKILLVDDDIELTDLLAEVLRLTGLKSKLQIMARSIGQIKFKSPVSLIGCYDACTKWH